jgi:amidase
LLGSRRPAFENLHESIALQISHRACRARAPQKGQRSGLPVGYQAIAAQGRDKTSLTFARLAEKAFGGFSPPPGFD